MNFDAAPELQTTDWLNTDESVSLGALRGKVVVIEAFQMLCPGCVSHGLPQAMRVHRVFSRDEVAVVGLHTVFEHHDAQGSRAALAAFLHEYKITFPVGMDAPSDSGELPRTMALYGMQGTPTLLLVDKRGRLRKHKFGWRTTSCSVPRSCRSFATTQTCRRLEMTEKKAPGARTKDAARMRRDEASADIRGGGAGLCNPGAVGQSRGLSQDSDHASTALVDRWSPRCSSHGAPTRARVAGADLRWTTGPPSF